MTLCSCYRALPSRLRRFVLVAAHGMLACGLVNAAYVDLSKGRPPAILDARVGANTPLGDDPDALPATQRGQAEPHIVRSIAHPNTLLAIFQEGRFFDAGAISCGYAISHDGGQTWRRSLIPRLTLANGGRYNRATDPVAGAGPQGDLYLQTLVSVQGSFQLAAVVISRSTDHGATWSEPVTVFEATVPQISPDKNWLAVNDHAASPTAGRLVSTWTQFSRTATGAVISNPIVASVSDDRGLTWTALVNITADGSLNQGTQPVFLPDGSLAVVYITFPNPQNTSQFRIECKRSLDGGRTFPAASSTVVNAVNGFIDPVMRAGVFLPSVAMARQSGELFVTYVGLVAGSPRVLVTKSADRGATWSPPVVASDQPAGVSVLNPAIATLADGRTVSVVFMDKRHAPDGRNFVDHYAAISTDGGATWLPNIRLSEMSSDVRFGPATGSGVMLGDYIGLAPPNDPSQPFVAIWCDTRTGDSDPFTARFAATAAANFFGWAALHGINGARHDEDTDGDGVPNYLEYVNGTNAVVPEVGDDLVVLRTSPTSIDVAWVERENAQRLFSDGAAFAGLPLSLPRPFGGSAAVAGLSPDSLPSLPAGPGRSWRGARFNVTPGGGFAFARAYRFSAGLPVVASGVLATNRADSRLVNLSTRGRSGSGAEPMIAGFVLDGPKSILLRVAGPSLAAVGVPGVLADPRLTLLALASDLELTNDNWEQGGASAAIFARVGAFPFAGSSLDSALALELGPQAYSAIVSSPANAGGVALIEAYDADATPGAQERSRFLNLSTRAEVGAGGETLVSGFVISGTQPRQVLIRAVGPTLARLGVTGAIPDPRLTLHRGNGEIARNDDWEISRSAAVVAATAHNIGAFPLDAGSLDAALLITLPPGAYTVVVDSMDGAGGMALIEVYDADR